MLDFLSQAMNLFTIHTKNKTKYLKRKLYENNVTLSKSQYHKYVFWAWVIDIITMATMYFVLSAVHLFHGNQHWTLIPLLKFWVIIGILLAILIFFVIITYDLLVYPRRYLKAEQPICYYSSNGQDKRAVVLDLFQNKALVNEIKTKDQKCEYLKLINLSQIKYIEKAHKVNKSGLRHDLLKIWHAIDTLWTKSIQEIVKPFYKASRSKYQKLSHGLKKENSSLKAKIKVLKDKTQNKVKQHHK